jgi:5-formyltetrahydrofolate cyclo-ligase
MTSAADVAALKARLREEMRRRRATLEPAVIRDSCVAVTRQLVELLPHSGGFVGLYSAVRGEVGVDDTLLRSAGLTLAWPVVSPSDGLLRFVASDSAPTVPGAYGIPEPAHGIDLEAVQLDAVVIPGVAFTKAGDRLGQGAGYYDRFLGALRDDALRVGIGYEWQVVATLPIEGHDERLTHVVTEKRTIITGHRPGSE